MRRAALLAPWILFALAVPGVALAQTAAKASAEASAPAGGFGFGFAGARVFYTGLELDLLYAKSTSNESSGMIGLDPNLEIHILPRWSVQAHGFFAFGLGNDQPDAWWDVGLRGIWRPPFLPAQSLGLGLGLGQAKEIRSGRARLESVSPMVDLQAGLWQFDIDPVRFGPQAHFGVNFQGSVFVGVGLLAQLGWGSIRTTTD